MKNNPFALLLFPAACFAFQFALAQQKPKDIKQTNSAISITSAKQMNAQT
jgi:hypothetical protein